MSHEGIPSGWKVMTSRSKGLDYYFNEKNGKKFWVDEELPDGWSHIVEADHRRYYFHISDEKGTKTYEKPIRQVHSEEKSHTNDPQNLVYDPPPQVSQRRGSNSLQDLLSPVGGTSHHDDDRQREEIHHETKRARKESPHNYSTTRDEPRNVRPYDPVMDASTPSRHSTSTNSIRPDAPQSDQQETANFYSKLTRNSTSDRADSLLYHMRCMNNWVKSVLIQEYTQKRSRVLDLACGKGGDMNKWQRNDFQMYMGVDIAKGSLDDAAMRIQKSHQLSQSDIHLVLGDLGQVSLLKDTLECWNLRKQWHHAIPLEHPGSFDVVSMQFAFHYMFCDEDRAKLFFETLRTTLRPGGMFIATTIDPNRIIQKLMQSVGANDIDDDGIPTPAPIRLYDGKDRALCTIRMDPSTRERILYGNENDPGYGLRYNFTLIDSLEDEAVNLPEYLIPTSLLRQLIHEHGFDLVLQENFQTFIGDNKEKYKNLLTKMNVLNFQGTISDVEWEIAGLYQVLAFKKRIN